MSKIRFITELKNTLTHEDNIIIRNLYTPIIGVNSTTLYSILNDYNYINKKTPTYNDFDDIAKTMNIDFEELIESKNKLEAVGLLRTFERNDSTSFLFLINPPLMPADFKKNKMLTKNCMDQVGEIIFNRFFFAVKHQEIIKNDFKEVTIKYQDLFNLFEPNTQNTLEIPLIKYRNRDEAIKGLTSSQFVKFLTSDIVTPSQLNLIQRLQSSGLDSWSINEIIAYTFESNGKFVSNHIEKIANDMISKGITSPHKIAKELEAARKHQSKNHYDVEEIHQKNSPEDHTELSWNDIFETLGGEL